MDSGDIKTKLKNVKNVYYALRIGTIVFLVISGGTLTYGLGFLTGASTVVDPGEKAVHTSGAVYQGVVGSGWKFGIPGIDRYRVFDMRHNTISYEGGKDNALTVGTSDDVIVFVNLNMRWDINNSEALGQIFKQVEESQEDLRDNVVVPALKDAASICAASRTAREINTLDTEGYKECIMSRSSKRLAKVGITVVSISITNVDYSDDLQQKYNQQKELDIKEENAEKRLEIANKTARRQVIVARKAGKAQVIRAEKRAEAFRKINSRLNPQLLRYLAIKDGLSNSNTVYVIPAKDGMVPISSEVPLERTNTSIDQNPDNTTSSPNELDQLMNETTG